MKFAEWMLFTEKVERISPNGREVRVWVNPSLYEVESLFNNHVFKPPPLAATFWPGKPKDEQVARGIVDSTGTVYIWNAGSAIHLHIIREFGLTQYKGFFIWEKSGMLWLGFSKKGHYDNGEVMKHPVLVGLQGRPIKSAAA